MQTSFIDARIFDNLRAGGHWFGTTATIQSKSDANDAAGQPNPTWSNLASHVNLPCAFGLTSGPTPDIAERRRADMTVRSRDRVIVFPDIYASITEAMRAVVDSEQYDILSVEHDSHLVMTRLRVQKVTASA